MSLKDRLLLPFNKLVNLSKENPKFSKLLILLIFSILVLILLKSLLRTIIDVVLEIVLNNFGKKVVIDVFAVSIISGLFLGILFLFYWTIGFFDKTPHSLKYFWVVITLSSVLWIFLIGLVFIHSVYGSYPTEIYLKDVHNNHIANLSCGVDEQPNGVLIYGQELGCKVIGFSGNADSMNGTVTYALIGKESKMENFTGTLFIPQDAKHIDLDFLAIDGETKTFFTTSFPATFKELDQKPIQ